MALASLPVRDYGGRIWYWERPECEAMRRRGQTLERPWPCFVSDTGYQLSEDGEHG